MLLEFSSSWRTYILVCRMQLPFFLERLSTYRAGQMCSESWCRRSFLPRVLYKKLLIGPLVGKMILIFQCTCACLGAGTRKLTMLPLLLNLPSNWPRKVLELVDSNGAQGDLGSARCESSMDLTPRVECKNGGSVIPSFQTAATTVSYVFVICYFLLNIEEFKLCSLYWPICVSPYLINLFLSYFLAGKLYNILLMRGAYHLVIHLGL